MDALEMGGSGLMLLNPTVELGYALGLAPTQAQSAKSDPR